MNIKFYGTRGSIPASLTAGELKEKILSVLGLALIDRPTDAKRWLETLPFDLTGTFGGDTTCCRVRCGEVIVVFDLGSGLRRFGMDIFPEMFQKKGMRIHFGMSHVHWDHVQGFPFFAPLFIPQVVLPNNNFVFYGGTNWHKTLEEVLQGQMDPPVFPVEWDKIIYEGPRMNFSPIFNRFTTEIVEGSDQVKLTAIRLNHPNETYGWRLEHGGKIFVFASDTEPYPGGPDPMIVSLAQGADALYLDGQYYEAQYLGKKEAGGLPRMGWGHGYDSWCAEVAKAAGVKQLYIGHHDPAASDTRIMQNIANIQKIFPNAIAAYDGMEVDI